MTVQISGTVGMQLPSTGGGIEEEVDPLALKAANNLSDLNDAPTALENIGVVDSNGHLEAFDARNLTNVQAASTAYTVADAGDWSVEPTTVKAGLDELAARRYVTDGGTDGQVLTSDGANGYTWEDTAGGGGLAVSSQTVSTGNVTSGNSVDVNFAMPAGFTSVTVMSIEVTRTAGTGDSFTIEAFLDDARSASAGYMMGGSFDSLSIGADTEYGPRIVIFGSPQYLAIPYVNTDGSEFVRTTFTNNGGADGTFDVTLRMLPIN